MTDRKQALQDLLVKVEAGWPEHIDQAYMPPFLAAFDMTWVAMKAWQANEGSLDAAKALHEAVLPGWIANMTQLQNRQWIAQVVNPQGEEWPKWTRSPSWDCADTNPARAWLCAILKALIAEAGND